MRFTVVIQLWPQTNAIRFECKYVFAHCRRISNQPQTSFFVFDLCDHWPTHTGSQKKMQRIQICIYIYRYISRTMASCSLFVSSIHLFCQLFWTRLLKYLRFGMHTVNFLNFNHNGQTFSKFSGSPGSSAAANDGGAGLCAALIN